MMEAEWSARRVARQLGHSDCVVRRCWDQWIRDKSFRRRQAQETLDRPVVGKTTTSRLAERHLGSRCPLRVLPLTPTHRIIRLEWCRARGNWIAAEWNQVVFSDESRFNFRRDDNRVRVWRPRGERLNPAFALQRHTAPPADGKGVTRLSPHCYYPFLVWPIPRFACNRAYLGSFGTASWASHEFERTRGKVVANMERNVSRHHTELVCLNA
ncbi:transposable element Tcb1 transposase [Trichonephila clavipes]|uniref:Transposable element Tcb1 transposase n=1 Tax=Trichonephila clavipes TaxID=2585209 RepID=A0A8X6SFL6_TRICX|nr:transposable element Tcb1 transposase [Trichonephila clavipes]